MRQTKKHVQRSRRSTRHSKANKGSQKIVRELSKAQTTVRYQPPFGTSFRTRLVYAQYVDFNFAVANTPYNYQFNANSVFDPDRSGVGHQPYGHDQLSALFNRYRVMRFQYLCEVIPGNDIANSVIEWGTLVRNGTYTVAYPEVFELPFVKTSTMTTNGVPKALRGRVDLSRINERGISYITDDRTSADTGSNPSEVILFTFFGLSNQTNLARVRVTLTYDVEYFDPMSLGSSFVLEPSPGRNALLNFTERVLAYPMQTSPGYKTPPVLTKSDWDKKGVPKNTVESD